MDPKGRAFGLRMKLSGYMFQRQPSLPLITSVLRRRSDATASKLKLHSMDTSRSRNGQALQRSERLF